MVPYHHPHTVGLNCIRFIRHTLHSQATSSFSFLSSRLFKRPHFIPALGRTRSPCRVHHYFFTTGVETTDTVHHHSPAKQASCCVATLPGVYKTSKAGREQNTHSGRCEQQQRRQRCAVLGVLAPSTTTAEAAAVAAVAEERRWW